MNVEKQDVDRNMTRQHAAAEVIELGEMLFDTAIDVAALHIYTLSEMRRELTGKRENAQRSILP